MRSARQKIDEARAAALLANYAKPRLQWAILAVLLLGYWALLGFGGTFDRDGNLASRIDTALLGRFNYEFDAATGLGHDPEGLLSTLPAIATTLLGVRSGEWLRENDSRRMLMDGAIALALGAAWSLDFPINKNLWTSSFVLWAAGWSMLLLAAFHFAIDCKGWPAIGRRFGVNAIAIYAGAWIVECIVAAIGLSHVLATALFVLIGNPEASSLAYALLFVLGWWLAAYVLDARGIHVRI
jgi:predicted acyltransferase